MIRYQIILFVFLFLQNIFAGFIKGNGGNTLLCQFTKNQVLDFYELNAYYGFNFDESISIEKFDEEVLNRVALVDSNLKNLLASELQNIESRVIYVYNSKLGKVDDLITVLMPEDCELNQTALQFNQKILIDKNSFDKLDQFQQKVLLLHEAIYGMFIKKYNLQNSKAVRALVSLILSRELLFMSKAEVANFYGQEILPNL